MKRYSTVGKTGNVDDYINPGGSDELPPPPELADDKEHIKNCKRTLKDMLSRMDSYARKLQF